MRRIFISFVGLCLLMHLSLESSALMAAESDDEIEVLVSEVKAAKEKAVKAKKDYEDQAAKYKEELKNRKRAAEDEAQQYESKMQKLQMLASVANQMVAVPVMTFVAASSSTNHDEIPSTSLNQVEMPSSSPNQVGASSSPSSQAEEPAVSPSPFSENQNSTESESESITADLPDSIAVRFRLTDPDKLDINDQGWTGYSVIKPSTDAEWAQCFAILNRATNRAKSLIEFLPDLDKFSEFSSSFVYYSKKTARIPNFPVDFNATNHQELARTIKSARKKVKLPTVETITQKTKGHIFNLIDKEKLKNSLIIYREIGGEPKNQVAMVIRPISSDFESAAAGNQSQKGVLYDWDSQQFVEFMDGAEFE